MADMGMVEKVARRLAKRAAERAMEADPGVFARLWDSVDYYVSQNWTKYERDAREAIEELRDLPLALLRVGEQAWFEAHEEHRKKMAEMKARLGGIPSTECIEIPVAWRAMLDAILKEEGNG